MSADFSAHLCSSWLFIYCRSYRQHSVCYKLSYLSEALWLPYGIGQAIIFLPCGFFFFLSFFFFSSPILSRRRLDVYHTSTHGVTLVQICKFRMQVWNVLHATCWKCRTQKIAKDSPSRHHHTTLSGYIFATKAYIDSGKNLLSSNISSTCPHNMANVGPLWLRSVRLFGAPQVISTGFMSWQHYCTAL